MCTFLMITQNNKKTHAKKLRLNEYNIFIALSRTSFRKICVSMCGGEEHRTMNTIWCLALFGLR